MKKIFALLFILFLSVPLLQAQGNYRFFADVSVKTKDGKTGKGTLTILKVYYDKNKKKVVQEISFPEPTTIVLTDSASYKIVNFKAQKISHFDSRMHIIKSTIYHLILENNLANYGLDNSLYKKTKAEKEKNIIFTTWEPVSEKAKNLLGKIVIGTENKRIKAVLFFNPQGKLISKQVFKKYQTVQNVPVPTEIIQIIYDEDGSEKAYQLTTFKNVKINEKGNDNIYDYPLYFN